MKNVWVGFIGLLLTILVHAQDVKTLYREADQLERNIKEEEALLKYKQIIALDARAQKACVKAAELAVSIAMRQKDKKQRKALILDAANWSQTAWNLDSSSADAAYVMAMAAGQMTEVETENKKILQWVRATYEYAQKALLLDPNHSKANYTLGKWHYEVASLNWGKRLAVKAFFGGLPNADMQIAIQLLEKSKQLDPYLMVAYMDLAKAYQQSNQPAKAIVNLQQIQRLPIRTGNDAQLKLEAKKLLENL